MGANFDDFLALDFSTPEDATAWQENAELTPAQRRRFKAWVAEWRSDLGQAQVERLNTHSAAILKERNGLVDALEADCREAAQIPLMLKKGRITSKEATKRLAQLARNRESYLKILEAINGSIAQWETNADADPSDLLRATQERFRAGSPRHGTRTLTAAILRGEH